MGVTRQAPAAATGRLVLERKTDRQDDRQPQCNKGLAVAKQREVCRFAPEIGSDGAVVSRRVHCGAPVFPLCPQVSEAEKTQ